MGTSDEMMTTTIIQRPPMMPGRCRKQARDTAHTVAAKQYHQQQEEESQNLTSLRQNANRSKMHLRSHHHLSPADCRTRRHFYRSSSLSLTTFVIFTSFLALCFMSSYCTITMADDQVKQEVRSTQPTVERQLDTPNSVASPAVVSQASVKEVPAFGAANPSGNSEQRKQEQSTATANSGKVPASNKPASAPKPATGGQKRANSVSSAVADKHKNYDMYQLKATNSHHHYHHHQSSTTSVMPQSSSSSSSSSSTGEPSPTQADSSSTASTSADKSASAPDREESSSSVDKNKVASGNLAYKKLGYNGASAATISSQGSGKPAAGAKLSSFSLLKKFLPSFMTSAAGPAAAAAAAAATAVDKRRHSSSSSHSRSSSSHSSSALSGDGPLSKVSGKIINLLTSSSKKSGYGMVPDHAPFFTRKPSINDRQAGGFASSLGLNPLGLGLLFSAPLIPSLLLTPLAIAGLSPAMSAINNFFGDDEETSTTAPVGGPLAQALASGSSPLASILNQASGASGSSSPPSFAQQALQTFLGTPSTTEKPLFNPGMFASSGIQNAIGSLSSSSGSGSSSSQSSPLSSASASASSQSPIRSFLGGNSLIQTAASMISPSFAAPPSSSSGTGASASDSSAEDSDPGLLQVASNVFDKMAKYMSPERDSIAQASSSSSSSSSSSATPSSSGQSASQASSSPISSLVSLSQYSPFQLSSLFGPAVAPAIGATSGSSSGGSSHSGHRAGFFSTLKNVYELFSSSFLRRQEVNGDSNECQQRLICELHQRAMNSKLFRRSIQSNLAELANLDKSLQEQMAASHPLEARADSDSTIMLKEFLKATNKFANGGELVNCAKMFPRCSGPKLLSAANAHLTDPATGKTIGRFSSLMKKMKLKSPGKEQNQGGLSQWRLRSKSAPKPVVVAPIQVLPAPQQQHQYPMMQQTTDYMQVAPMSVVGASTSVNNKMMQPADSLKMVQQLMMQQQQQQQQQYTAMPLVLNQQQDPIATNQQQQMFGGPQQATYQSYPMQQQYPQASSSGQMSLYTDAVPSMARYNGVASTDSPYYQQAPQSNQQQQQPQASADLQVSQQQQMQSVSQQQPYMSSSSNNNNNNINYPQQYQTSTTAVSEQQAADKKVALASGSGLTKLTTVQAQAA